MQAILRQHEGGSVDYTPSTDKTAGNVVIQGNLVGVVLNDIPADRLGALRIVGVVDVVKETGEITAGADVYWHPTGDPVGGTADSGAATATETGATFMGHAVTTAASGDTTVRVVLRSARTIPDVG